MPKPPKIIPISDLRQDASGVIKLVSMKEYEQTQHELEILRLLARGEKEIEAGAGFDLESVLAEADALLAEQ